MAPKKKEGKPEKVIKKVIEKPISKTKKMKKKKYHSFSIYLYRLLRQETTDNMGISKRSMLIMNNFLNDMLEKIATEASRLVAHGKKTTLSSHEIDTAVKLLLPGELASHAANESRKAIVAYHRSRESQP